jgi:hypothetical protein
MTSATQHESDSAGSTMPILTMDTTLHLSTRTLTWLADQPHARRVVRSVWDKLTELERTGQHPGTLAALRRVLTYHQPTSGGQCRTCRRWRGCRRRFPCIVWHQVRGELLDLFAASQPGHRQTSPR